MRALVLGASGFLGSYAGYGLAKQGWDVTGLSRTPARGYPNTLGITELGDVSAAIASQRWDIIVNCLAVASHERCESDPAHAQLVNDKLPGRWAACARESGSRFVHFSTDAVFDGSSTDLYAEDDSAGAPSVYGKTKRAGELSVLAANPESLVFRTNFFGWSRDGTRGILDFFTSGLESGSALSSFSDYSVSSLYVAHLFRLMEEALTASGSGIYHLVSSTPMSKFDFGVALAHQMGADASLVEPGLLAENPALANRGHHLGLSVEKLEALVGHPIPSTEEGIEMAINERDAVMDYFRNGIVSRG